MNFPTEVAKRASKYQPLDRQDVKSTFLCQYCNRSFAARVERTFCNAICYGKFQNLQVQNHVQRQQRGEQKNCNDDDSDASDSTVSEDGSEDTGNTEPSAPLARVTDTEWYEVQHLGLATKTEAKWCQQTMKVQRQNQTADISFTIFEELLDNSGRMVARHFLRATKDGCMRDMLQNIPDAVAANAFKVKKHATFEDARDASPIIAALVHKFAQHKDDTKSLCECILKAKLATDNFFRMFVRAALSYVDRNACRLVKRFMDHVFFPKGMDYNVTAFPRHLSSILLEEIGLALENNQLSLSDDKINILFEYALRFESMPRDTTLQQWIESDRTGNNHLLFVKMIRDNSYFAKWLADICCPNSVLISRHRTSQCLKNIPTDFLPELNGDYKQRRRQHLTDALYGFVGTSLLTLVVPVVLDVHQHNYGNDSNLIWTKGEDLNDQYGEEDGLPTCVLTPVDIKNHTYDGETKSNSIYDNNNNQHELSNQSQNPSMAPFFSLPKMSEFFETYWDEELRDKVLVPLLRHGVRGRYADSIKNGDILNKPEHFSTDVLNALKAIPHYLPEDLFQKLVLSGIKLECYKNMIERLYNIEPQVNRDEECIRQLNDIVNEVLHRSETDFEHCELLLDDLKDCAINAARAKRIVSHQATATERLQCAFDHYLSHNAPGSWKELFRSAETIAFFIKYLDRENLTKAYTAYVEKNKDSSEVLELLNAVKLKFTKPIMSPKDFDLRKGSEQATEQLLEDLETTQGIDSVSMLRRLTAAWLRDRLNVLNVPMPPRNVQSITFLLVANWLEKKLAANSFSSLICQVGTGEGKSLVIAMMAVYAVKALGKKVHVLENNQGLLERDYESFKDFYQSMGVTTSCGAYDANTDICYVLRRTIEHSYRNRVFEGHVPPFPDTILIVDEVDELIVDGKPTSNYVKKDHDRSTGYSEAVTSYPNRPPGIKDSVWNLVSSACKKASTKIEGKDYVVTSSDVVALDGSGRHVSYTFDWLRVLKQRRVGGDASEHTTFFIQNMTHMFSQVNLYYCIVFLIFFS